MKNINEIMKAGYTWSKAAADATCLFGGLILLYIFWRFV